MAEPLLYNKYRSQTFSEVIGQEHITDALKGLVKNKNYKALNSIILACNNPGSGKTTIARVFAKAANCTNHKDGEPCRECEHCKLFEKGLYPDFIEIDGATYNKLEDIKPIVEIANMYPQVQGGTRFIIVDECHRLSNAAWDTMLKMLEEGKNDTVFLFCTTELHNVRPAIVSRSFLFNLEPLRWDSIYKQLKHISDLEGIEYDKDALKSIAKANEGKTRDAIKALDMCYKCYGKVDHYSSESAEILITNCLMKAFRGDIENARYDADKLIKVATSLSDVISRTLFSIFSYKESDTSYIPYELAEEANELFQDLLKDLIAEFLVYKPSTIEQLKLFLTIVAGKGIKSSKSDKIVTRKRVFIKDNTHETVSKKRSEMSELDGVSKSSEKADIDTLSKAYGFNKVSSN